MFVRLVCLLYREERCVSPTGLFGVSGGEMCLSDWSVWCIGKRYVFVRLVCLVYRGERDVFVQLMCLVYKEEICVFPTGLFGVSGREMCLSN